MKRKRVFLNIAFFAAFFMLFSSAVFAGYSLSTTSTTNGDSYWGSPILRMTASISGTNVTFTVRKTSGTFTSNCTVYLKVGTYQSYGANRAVGSISAGGSQWSHTHDLSAYSYPKTFYFRVVPNAGGWAWTGPITVYFSNSAPSSPTISSSPSTAIVGQTVCITMWRGNDPDGDPVKIQATATDSNRTNSNPYVSSWASGGSSTTACFVFTSPGTKTIWATTFDTNGAGSSVRSRTITVTGPNRAPNSPTISSSPTTAIVGQPVSITMWRGTDPDGDNVKIHATATNSNRTNSSPYVSSWSSGGTSTTATFTFSATGTQTIWATTFDVNGSGSSVASRTINVTCATPVITSVSPSMAAANSGGGSIYIYGSNFTGCETGYPISFIGKLNVNTNYKGTVISSSQIRYDYNSVVDCAVTDNRYVDVVVKNSSNSAYQTVRTNLFQVIKVDNVQPTSGTYTVGDSITINWSCNAAPSNGMTISIKRDSYQGSVEGPSYRILAGSTSNDGSQTFTIPSGISAGTDWRVWAKHSNTGAHAMALGTISISTAPPCQAPVITGVSPTMVAADSGGGTVDIYGNNFTSCETDFPKAFIGKLEVDPNYKGTLISSSHIRYNYNRVVDIAVTDNRFTDVVVKNSSDSIYQTSRSDLFQVIKVDNVQPAAGEYQKGDQITISWVCNAAPSEQMKISIKRDSYQGSSQGPSYRVLSNNTSNDGIQSFTIPNDIDAGTDWRVWVAHNNTGAVAMAPGTLTIPDVASTLMVTSPNGGENWLIGSPHDITWNATGLTGTLKITLWKDDVSLGIIAENLESGAGTYSWAVGNLNDGTTVGPGFGFVIKIKEIGTTIADSSDAPFSIAEQPEVQVVSPNGGENWPIDTPHDIIWNSKGLSGTVRITLWKDGISVGTIAENLDPGVGSFSWVVGYLNDGTTIGPAFGYSIKIEEEGTIVTDSSDAPFTITGQPTLQVVSPNGGENWGIDTTEYITWDASEVTGTLKITLWKDGASVGIITENLNPGVGSYPWTVGYLNDGTPVNAGPGFTIKIKEKGTTVADKSDTPFMIFDASPQPKIEIISPNGNEDWNIGTTRDITWNAPQVTGVLKITLLKDGNAAGIIADNLDPSTGVYSWSVGMLTVGTIVPAGTGYTIKIKEKGTAVADKSDAPFTIVQQPEIQIMSPNGDEYWELNTTRDISWNAPGVTGALKITLWKDGASLGIIADNLAPNPGRFSWAVGHLADGTVAAANSGYTIKIKEKGTTVADVSNAPFTISPPPQIRITSPNGGETIQPGTNYPVKWQTGNDFENVTLEYSPDNGTTYLTIADGIPNNGNYQWWVPFHISPNCLVRISSPDGTKTAQNTLVYEMTFKITETDSKPIPGETFTLWLGDASNAAVSQFIPTISFNRETDNTFYVQHNDSMAAIPATSQWYHLKVQIDPRNQSLSLWLNENTIIENRPLNPASIITPAVSLSVAPEDSAEIEIDNIIVRILQSTSTEIENKPVTLITEDFENFEIGTFPENSGWKITNTNGNDECALIELDASTGKKVLRLLPTGTRVFVLKHVNLPGRLPFDTSDKTFTIKTGNR